MWCPSFKPAASLLVKLSLGIFLHDPFSFTTFVQYCTCKYNMEHFSKILSRKFGKKLELSSLSLSQLAHCKSLCGSVVECPQYLENHWCESCQEHKSPPPLFNAQCNVSSLSFIHQAANFVNIALSGNAIANNSLTGNINLLFLFRGCIETGQWRMCYMSGRLVYRYEAIPGLE